MSTDVAAYIDTFRVVEKLRLQHWQRLSLGVFVAVAAALYNVVTPPAEALVGPAVSVPLAVCFLLGGAFLVRVRLQACARAARVPASTPRDQALRLAESVSRAGNAWLTWANLGHLLLGLGTLARLKFSWSVDAFVLWAGLVPTVALLVQGLLWPPTRERVLGA
jgi:hypothetical protein